MKNAYNTINASRNVLALAAVLVLFSGVALAHHGSGISYDTGHLWTTWATVTQFNYLNPHPSMTFDRTTKDGKIEHWTSELLTNPSALVRAGWTKSRSIEGLKRASKSRCNYGYRQDALRQA